GNAPPPTSGCATACPPEPTTRSSRRAPARPAPGATTAATAPKAPRPPRPAAPGTASPPTDASGGAANGGGIRARGLGRVPELGQRARRGGGRLDGGGVRGRRDAQPASAEPAGHVLLRRRGP